MESKLFTEKPEDCFIFTLYSIDKTAFIMQHYIRLGFDLELYHHTELLSIYWYYDTIINYQIQHLRHIVKAPVLGMFHVCNTFCSQTH